MGSLDLLLPLALALTVAKLSGALARRAGLPAVLGDLLTGVALGPVLLGVLQPNDVLKGLADLGVLVLLFIVGLETDLITLRTVGVASSAAAVGGVLVTLVGGSGAAILLGLPPLEAIFVATLLSATSVSISAQTLLELGQLRSRVGATILGGGVIDDVLGIIVLSLLLALTRGADPIVPALRVVIFTAAGLLIGRHLIPPYVRWAHRLHSKEAAFGVVVSVVFVYAWSAEALGGLAAITGAYLAGVLVGRTEVARESLDAARTIGEGILIPLFLVSVGLEARFDSITANPTLFVGLALVAVATKVVGCGLGALVGRIAWRDALRVGLGMVPRGEVTLAAGAIALRAGAITQGVLGTAVLVTLFTILIEPLLLRAAYASKGDRVQPVEALGGALGTAAD